MEKDKKKYTYVYIYIHKRERYIYIYVHTSPKCDKHVALCFLLVQTEHCKGNAATLKSDLGSCWAVRGHRP